MDNEKLTAPYASTENVIRVLEKAFQTGVNGPIDSPYLQQLGIGATMTSRTLHGLRFLGFIDDEGNAQPLLHQYVKADNDERLRLLQDAIKTAYAVIFRAADPTRDDRTKIWTAFKVMQPSKQWDRMVTFFLGMCKYAGIEVVDAPSNRPAKRILRVAAKGNVDRHIITRRKDQQQPPPANPPLYAPPANNLRAIDEKLLDKFPSFDPSWPDEIKSKWFEGFATLQEQLKK